MLCQLKCCQADAQLFEKSHFKRLALQWVNYLDGHSRSAKLARVDRSHITSYYWRLAETGSGNQSPLVAFESTPLEQRRGMLYSRF